MSLVHEALEKAKREASARSARDLGLPEPAGQPFRARRSRRPLLLGGVAALTAAVVMGTAYWLFRPMIARSPPAGPVTAVAPTDAGAPASPLTPAATAASPAAPTLPTAERVAAPAERQAPPASPRPSAGPPAPRKLTESSVAASGSPTSSGSASSAPAFKRQVTLADGTVIRLGGIAWSEEAPLAYLNGKLYVRGESVAGLRVERIERERVLLVGADGRRLVLTLH